MGVNGDRSVAERGERPALGGHPVADRAVADLVVVLAEDDELLGGRSGAGAP
jgi:hypothetical protein